jgi:hypothetical protein
LFQRILNRNGRVGETDIPARSSDCDVASHALCEPTACPPDSRLHLVYQPLYRTDCSSRGAMQV